MPIIQQLSFGVAVALLLCSGTLATAEDLPLIPEPRSTQLKSGSLTLTAGTRIVVENDSLLPLGHVLSDEMNVLTGLHPSVSKGAASPGDIAIGHSSTLHDEAYRLEVGPVVRISGGTYTADAWGTVTLLQSITTDGSHATIPKMTIDDAPDMPYRGFMKDVARQDVPIESLFATAELCRLYKVRYLHLHLSDDHAWVFPSTAYPKLGSRNEGAHSGPTPRVYDLKRLKELVKYADDRGVTIVPEIEGPGHSGAMRLSLPDLFDSPKTPGGGARLGIMNMASPDVYHAMDVIIGEVADVFASSPYIQIGCDEVGADAVKSAHGYAAFMAEHRLKNPNDLFSYYVTQIVGFTKQRHKTPIAWEGVPLARQSPADLILMMWTQNCGAEAKAYAAKGYRLINAQNGGFSGPREAMEDLSEIGQPTLNFTTDLYSFGFAHLVSVGANNPKVIGAQVNDWESTWDYAEPIARRAVPAREANAWSARHPGKLETFIASLEHTDAIAERLIEPITATDATSGSLDAKKYIQRLRKHTPFYTPMTVTLSNSLPGSEIHFALDGSKLSPGSKRYAAPLTFDTTTTLNAAVFDKAGVQLSPEQRWYYDKVEYEPSLTLGKPVTASAVEGDCSPSYITDGFAAKDIWRGWWGAGPCPQWVKIDLQEPQTVGRVVVVPYWDGSRSYQYVVEVSTDDSTWTQVVDMSKNTALATPKGHSTSFTPILARYIRVTVLHNTANSGAHLVEVRAFNS